MKNRFTIIILFSLFIFSNAGYSQDDSLAIGDFSLESLLNIEISTASKYKQKAIEAPASVTIITHEDINHYGYRNLDEVFQGVRGFYTSYDRNYNYLGVRGFGRPTDYNNRILIQINGQTINESFYNSAPSGNDFPVNMDIVERIEIVRGPGSALYGTSAMFAVVNIITKQSNTFDGFKVSAEVGSYSSKKGLFTFGREFESGIELMISTHYSNVKGQNFFFKEFDDPSSNNGIAKDLDNEKFYNFITTLEYKDFKFQALFNSREKEIPTAPYESKFNTNSRTKDEYYLAQLEYNSELFNDLTIMVKTSAANYYYKGLYPYEDEEDGEAYTYDSFDENKNLDLTGEVQLIWDSHTNNRVVSGVEYKKINRSAYRIWDEYETYFDQDHPHNILSFYLQDEYSPFQNFSIIGGIRWDSYSDRGSSTTPRIALVSTPLESTTFKLLYGEAFRVASLYETYYEDQFYGHKTSNNLIPEKISTVEFDLEHRFNKWFAASISVYENHLNNLIDTNIDPADSLLQFQNVNRIEAQGIELEIRVQPDQNLRGYLNYAYQVTKDSDLDEEISNSPSHLLKAGMVYLLFDQVFLAPEFFYESERFTVYDAKTDAYFLTNLNLTSKTLLDHFKLSLKVRNFFDVKYQIPGGYEHLQNSFTQDGRNFIFKLDYKF